LGTKDNRRKSHLIVGLCLSLALTCGGLSYGSYKMNNLEKYISEQSEVIGIQGKKIEELDGLTNQQKETIDIIKEENAKLNKSLEEKVSELQVKAKEIEALKKEEEEAKEVSAMPSRGEAANYKEYYVEATGYIAMCSEGCTGITATGYDLKANPNAKVIAVDPDVIPLGSKVHVEGYGYAVALDTGGAIDDYKIDLHFPTTAAAKEWGRKKVKIKVFN
jgi:3D (Asp-Asp-Asp) domain-containing protein